jgi:DNA adenine methylase
LEQLDRLYDRLRGVIFLDQPALDVIRAHDGPDTLIYCDPPYLHATRTARHAYGAYEMSNEEHQELLETLLDCRGAVYLSGYRSALYDRLLSGWAPPLEWETDNKSGQGQTKGRRVECLWRNAAAVGTVQRVFAFAE